MKVYSIDRINFQANKLPPVKTIKTAPETFTKEIFYEHIKQYLSNGMNKKEYLKKFLSGIDAIQARKGGAEFTPVEKKYINDLITTLDLTESLDKISDRYLTENMKKLLDNKKQF